MYTPFNEHIGPSLATSTLQGNALPEIASLATELRDDDHAFLAQQLHDDHGG